MATSTPDAGGVRHQGSVAAAARGTANACNKLAGTSGLSPQRRQVAAVYINTLAGRCRQLRGGMSCLAFNHT
eukprot:8416523-Pyramimonas_sp.AAC.1